MTTIWLIDKSAIGRLHLAADAAAWAERIERGLVRISTVTRLEIGFSARPGGDHQALFAESPIASMPVEYLTPLIEDRAVAVQSALAERGQHRAPSIPDLLIAATAELAELTVLHLDKDFELIASLTGQPLERLELRWPPPVRADRWSRLRAQSRGLLCGRPELVNHAVG